MTTDPMLRIAELEGQLEEAKLQAAKLLLRAETAERVVAVIAPCAVDFLHSPMWAALDAYGDARGENFIEIIEKVRGR